ncbi:hypothetical protein GIB67_025977 [Kingdonia uniflora]|uniref:Protein kinase domain-containing protein n=1 Tax=Kingdonia uniflora TaxID=39325 RepID=A0A7J7L835_9MAGN|nr:hypothetical protein GIB67_025977 [Kingdonia uniflora]
MAKEKPIRFSPQQLESFTGKYSRKLGSGGFGIVYKGKYPNGVELAVKVLNSSATEEVKEQFMAEVRTIGRTYHKNLVRLYGFCFDANLKALVYDYGMMLFEIALGKKNLDITMSERQQWLPIRVWEKLERGELCDFMGFNGVKDEDITKASLLCTVALWCVQYFPEARPSMIKVVQMLEGSVEVTTPPNPFQHLISSGIGLAVCSQTTEGISENSYKDSTPIMKKYEIELAISS